MNLQVDRIHSACETLKLNTLAVEWSAIAGTAAGTDNTLADFLEQLLSVELDVRTQRTRETLLKFAGLPAIKRFEEYDFKFATGAPKKQLQELKVLPLSSVLRTLYCLAQVVSVKAT
jgi:DNA replication protein DnaC